MQLLQNLTIKQKQIMAGLLTVAVPTSYIVYRHIGFESKKDSKLRMLIHHATFLTSFGVGLVFMHQAIKNINRWKKTPWKIVWRVVAGGMIPAIGFEGGFYVAKFLVPKKKAPQPMQPLPASSRGPMANPGIKPGTNPGAAPIQPAPKINPYNQAKAFPGQDIGPSQYLTPAMIANSRPAPRIVYNPYPSYSSPISIGSPTSQRTSPVTYPMGGGGFR